MLCEILKKPAMYYLANLKPKDINFAQQCSKYINKKPIPHDE